MLCCSLGDTSLTGTKDSASSKKKIKKTEITFEEVQFRLDEISKRLARLEELIERVGPGIGKFYSNLIAEGIPEEVALDMTKKFVGALDFTKLMSMVSNEASVDIGGSRKKKKRHESDDDEEFE